MNTVRAVIAALVVITAAGCEGCGDPPMAPPVAESAPAQKARSAEAPARSLDDVGGGGPGAAPAAARKDTEKASAAREADGVAGVGNVGRSAIRFFKTLFDGDTLIVQRNGVRRVACDRACALEEQCGFRDLDACRAASCDDDVRRPSRMDYCLALDSSVTCLDAATCSCNESCWKRGECAGDHDHDAECERTCLTLVKHEGISRYRENRCVLERSCAEIATCGAL